VRQIRRRSGLCLEEDRTFTTIPCQIVVSSHGVELTSQVPEQRREHPIRGSVTRETDFRCLVDGDRNLSREYGAGRGVLASTGRPRGFIRDGRITLRHQACIPKNGRDTMLQAGTSG
jgi:hypothetical protein